MKTPPPAAAPELLVSVPVKDSDDLNPTIVIKSPHAEALLAVLAAARECCDEYRPLEEAIAAFDALVKGGS